MYVWSVWTLQFFVYSPRVSGHLTSFLFILMKLLSWRRSLRGQAQGLHQLFLLDSSSSFTVTDGFFFWKLSFYQQAELLVLCFSFPLGTLPPPTPVVMFLKALFLAVSLKLSLSTIICVLMTPQMRSSPWCLIQAQDSSSLIHIHPPSLSLSLSAPLLPPVLGQVQN